MGKDTRDGARRPIIGLDIKGPEHGYQHCCLEYVLAPTRLDVQNPCAYPLVLLVSSDEEAWVRRRHTLSSFRTAASHVQYLTVINL